MSRHRHVRTAIRVTGWLCALSAWVVGSPTASAQSDPVSIELFEPLPAQGHNLLNLSESSLLPHLGFAAGVFTHYAASPLVIVDDDDRSAVTTRLIEDQVTIDIGAAIGLFDFASLGVVLPLTVVQSGDDLAPIGRAGEKVEGVALGDLRIIPKFRILDPDAFGGFGLHLTVPVHVPIGDKDTFKSDDGVRVQPTLGLDFRTAGGFVVAANVGYQVRPTRRIKNYESDDTIRWAVGVQVPTIEPLKVLVSLFGSAVLADTADPLDPSATIGESVSTPVEVVGALELTVADGLVVTAGGGATLVHGVGSPDARGFLGIGWTSPRSADPDDDNISGSADQCPSEAEDFDGFEDEDGCPDPDNDGDGVLDGADACPNEAEDMDGKDDHDGCPDVDEDADGDGVIDSLDACRSEPEDKDGYRDDDGCPDPDNDSDGLPDTTDKCPDEAEDMDGFADDDGCPETDVDGDGVPDETDRCPEHPETKNGFEDFDGCPDTTEKGVKLTVASLTIDGRIDFVGRTEKLRPKSLPTLATVARVLKANLWITKLQVEAHTDSEGTDEFNLEMSQNRAAEVVKVLREQGVDAGRLVAKGFGESKPIATNRTPHGRAKNRRVLFTILATGPAPVAPPAEQPRK